MKSYIWLVLLLALLAGQAGAANNAPATLPMVASGSCSTFPNCPVVPNDATHAWFFAPATGATFAVTGTFWQNTQPVSAASLPLPAGAATSANQTAIQSAPGTPQTTAVTIQGNASGVPVPVSGTVTAASPASSTAVTPTAPAGAVLTLTTGGTSQNLANANACPNFIYIQNGLSTADQGGIAAVEPIYVNLTGNSASATPGGQSFAIYPGTTPIFVAQTTAIKWVAATTGHAINAWCE